MDARFSTYALVSAGGALGTLARYGAGLLMQSWNRHLPWGTIVINIAGSFIIGCFGTLTLAHGRYPASENMRLFVMAGICGGFTTFSSFSLQTLDLLRQGATARACANVLLSVALCLCAVAAGHSLASHFNPAAAQIAQTAMEEEA